MNLNHSRRITAYFPDNCKNNLIMENYKLLCNCALKVFWPGYATYIQKVRRNTLSLNLAQEHVVFAVNVEDILVWKSVLWIDFCLDKFCGTNIKKVLWDYIPSLRNLLDSRCGQEPKSSIFTFPQIKKTQ